MKKRKIIALFLAILMVTTAILTSCTHRGNGQETESESPLAEVDPIDDNYRVFYQIFVGSFSDSDGDGIGDLRGIINRLDYLNDGNIHSGKSLGVQGIWLSPIFASPTYHKYDATDYYKIDQKFGTEDDLKELIALCHERNVKVILDLAINHTSTNHSWFVKFRNARKNGDTSDPYYDFYTCVNSETKVAGRTYCPLDGCPGEYYEANFDSGMPELNYDNPAVREEVVKVAKYYLDLGIDGFRFDAIKYIYYGDTAASSAFWSWYMDQLRAIKDDIYAVGECWASDTEVLEYYPALNCFNFTSSQLGQIYEAVRNGRINSFTGYIASYQERIRQKNPEAMYCPFIANHDTDRAAGYLPVTMGQMQMAANLYILCCGSPFIYYGEEIGMKGSRGSTSTDANRRLAMLWGDGDTVKDPVGTTYTPDKQTNGTVVAQLEDPDSLLNYYQRLICLRNKYPEIARGDYTALSSEGAVGGFRITCNDSVIGLLHNTSAEEVQVPLPAGAENFTVVCDSIGFGEASLDGNVLTIGPLTSVILK